MTERRDTPHDELERLLTSLENASDGSDRCCGKEEQDAYWRDVEEAKAKIRALFAVSEKATTPPVERDPALIPWGGRGSQVADAQPCVVVPQEVWQVWGKTCNLLFDTEEAAKAFVSSQTASVGGGLQTMRREIHRQSERN